MGRLTNSPLADILLKEGESLSAKDTEGGRHPNLGLVVGDAQLTAVELTHWNWEYPKTRTVPSEAKKGPPYKVQLSRRI